jgi:predicted flap endonuclease-1-like 5' DNA nuclease
MFLISQTLIYLILALIIGGAIGYAFRECLADTACDDVREDLALTQSRYQALLERESDVRTQPVSGLAAFPVAAPLAQATTAFPVAALNLGDLDARDFEKALLDAAPGTSPKMRFTADDLTAINGITPKGDAWLANIGITRLADIVSLTAGELHWLVENLPENGTSVYRDHWVAQANALLTRR